MSETTCRLCQCRDCRNARALARAVRAIKAELPTPEYDWEDLERQDREYRQRVGKPVWQDPECSSCGEYLEPGASVCEECGEPTGGLR